MLTGPFVVKENLSINFDEFQFPDRKPNAGSNDQHIRVANQTGRGIVVILKRL